MQTGDVASEIDSSEEEMMERLHESDQRVGLSADGR